MAVFSDNRHVAEMLAKAERPKHELQVHSMFGFKLCDGRRVEWKPPVYNTIHHILTNPIYA